MSSLELARASLAIARTYEGLLARSRAADPDAVAQAEVVAQGAQQVGA